MTEQEIIDISKRAAEATIRQLQPTIDRLEAENTLMTRAIVAHQERSLRYAYTVEADDAVKVGDFIKEEL